MRSHILVIAIAATAAVVGLAGCGDSKSPVSSRTTSSGAAASSSAEAENPPSSEELPTQINVGNTVNWAGSGETATLDCADGKTLDVAGDENTLTVTGTCKKVRVFGSDNTITVDKVDEKIHILIGSSNNTITYKEGTPEIEDSGSDNNVTQG